jgi:predicted TIM-barrel fold metal-dependent hydrolase
MSMHLTRRDFLIAGAGMAAVASAGAQVPSIIDTHVHFYDPTRAEGVPWPAKNDALLYRTVLPPAYSAVAHPFGITGVVIVEASAWLEDNQWILDVMKDNALLVGFVGHLNPGTDDFRQHLASFAKNRLFRGIRVSGADIAKGVGQQAFMDDLQRLADADLSMDALGDSAMVAPLTTIAGKIPNLRVVIDHMPVEPPGWKPDAMRELARHPQVYSKVSTVLKREEGRVSEDPAAYKASLDEVWDIFGPDRVLYGSNWPVSENLGPYAAVFKAVNRYVTGRGPADSDKYFSKNSKACYKWIDRT